MNVLSLENPADRPLGHWVCVILKPGSTPKSEQITRLANHNAPRCFVPRYLEFADAPAQTPATRIQRCKRRGRGVSTDSRAARAAGFQVER